MDVAPKAISGIELDQRMGLDTEQERLMLLKINHLQIDVVSRCYKWDGVRLGNLGSMDISGEDLTTFM